MLTSSKRKSSLEMENKPRSVIREVCAIRHTTRETQNSRHVVSFTSNLSAHHLIHCHVIQWHIASDGQYQSNAHSINSIYMRNASKCSYSTWKGVPICVDCNKLWLFTFDSCHVRHMGVHLIIKLFSERFSIQHGATDTVQLFSQSVSFMRRLSCWQPFTLFKHSLKHIVSICFQKHYYFRSFRTLFYFRLWFWDFYHPQEMIFSICILIEIFSRTNRKVRCWGAANNEKFLFEKATKMLEIAKCGGKVIW